MQTDVPARYRSSLIIGWKVWSLIHSQLFRANYTNFTIGEKFRNSMGLYHVMEFYDFQNDFWYWVTSPQFHHGSVFCCYIIGYTHDDAI